MLVVATGVFEILHPGHIRYLERSRELGDCLVVVVARDETAKKRKRRPVISEGQRQHMVGCLKPVDKAIIGGQDMYSTIVDLNPDILTLGADQDFDEVEVESRLRSLGLSTKVVRIKDYWDGGLHSSTIIADLIKGDDDNP